MRPYVELVRAFRAELMASLGLLAACGSGGGDTGSASETGTSSTSAMTSAPTTGGPGGTSGSSSGDSEGATTGTTTTTGAPVTGTDSTGGSSSSSGTTSTTGTSTTGTSSGTTDDTSSGTSTGTTGDTTDDTGGFTCPPPPPNLTQEYVCFPVPMGLPDCAACDDLCTEDNANAAATGDPLCSYTELVVQCGPDPMPAVPGECCYFIAHDDGMVCAGRPFVVAGAGRVAAPVRRGDWTGDARPSPLGLSEATRAALAGLWGAAAADEHASVAAFARFALQLLQVGAPASLVEEAQRAMADEIAHARACYALAGAYAGCPIGPGDLDMAHALGSEDLPALAAAAVREGCVGETLAAVVASAAAGQARDPAVRAVLRQIAADEARHAQLAWCFVQWALGRSPAVHAAVRDAFVAALAAPVAVRPWREGADPAALRAHGWLAPDEQAALCRDALAGVVAPAADALLASQVRAA